MTNLEIPTQFYKVSDNSGNSAIETAILLLSFDFTELDRAGEEDHATKLFVDRNAKVFWFTDTNSLRLTERIYSIDNQKVSELTPDIIESWFNPVTI